MTKDHPPEGEIEHLTEHYEQLSDEDVLAEWERGAPVMIDVDEPMASRSVRFSRHTMERLREVARVRGIGGNPAHPGVDRGPAQGRRRPHRSSTPRRRTRTSNPTPARQRLTPLPAFWMQNAIIGTRITAVCIQNAVARGQGRTVRPTFWNSLSSE